MLYEAMVSHLLNLFWLMGRTQTQSLQNAIRIQLIYKSERGKALALGLYQNVSIVNKVYLRIDSMLSIESRGKGRDTMLSKYICSMLNWHWKTMSFNCFWHCSGHLGMKKSNKIEQLGYNQCIREWENHLKREQNGGVVVSGLMIPNTEYMYNFSIRIHQIVKLIKNVIEE